MGRIVLQPSVGRGYTTVAPGIYPYEDEVSIPAKSNEYYLCIRAFDMSGNEDTNTVVIASNNTAVDEGLAAISACKLTELLLCLFISCVLLL